MKPGRVAVWSIIAVVFFLAVAVASAEELILTPEEQAFVEAHPVIHLGADPKFVPFEFFDQDQRYRGITADFLDLLAERTGLTFEVARDLTWPEAYERALNRDVDALPAVSYTEDRAQYFLFSEPYFSFRRVIVTRNTEPTISDLTDLDGQTVAVQRNSSHHSYLLSRPGINLSLYDSVEGALTAVADGSERAFVGNLATTDYLIRTHALTNLKFIAFQGDVQQTLHFAVRPDWPELVSILNKGLASITEAERLAISSRWIEFQSEINYGPIMRVVGMAAFALALILAVSSYWIRRLKIEIHERQRILARLEQAKQEADEANEFKSRFMARISHEIRTPLHAITGITYLWKRHDRTPQNSLYAERITQAANTMLGLINDILDFAKIEAGRITFEDVSFELDQVLQNAVNIVSYKMEEQEIHLVVDRDAKVPAFLRGDSTRLEQILLNLLSNAAKFTEEGCIFPGRPTFERG